VVVAIWVLVMTLLIVLQVVATAVAIVVGCHVVGEWWGPGAEQGAVDLAGV
jgi:hypothetical protein